MTQDPQWPVSQLPAPRQQPATMPFSLHWGVWLAFVPAAVLVVGLNVTTFTREPARQVGYCIGLLLGMLACSVIPALIGFYISGRSRLAASVVFLAFLGLVVMGQLGLTVGQAVAARQKQAEQLKAFDNDVEQTRQDFVRQLERGQMDPSAATQAIDRMSATFDKTAGAVSGDDAAMLRIASEFLQQMKAGLQRYSVALDALVRQTPMDPKWVKTRSDLVRSRESIRALKAQSDALRELIKEAPGHMEAALARSRVPPAKAKEFMRGFNAKLDRGNAKFQAIRDDDDQMVASLLKAVDLLDREWGKWRTNPATGTLEFDSTRTVQEFQKVAAELQALAAHQARMQQEYARIMGE